MEDKIPPTLRSSPNPQILVSPDFRCPVCDASVGARRASAETPWEPQDCHLCKQKQLNQDAAKRRKLGNVAAGVDIDKAFEAYRKFPPFAGNLGRHIQLEVGQRTEAKWSGHAATYRRKIRVAYGPDADAAEVLEVLAHEMCHLAIPPREGHGERFRFTLRRAARELWGIEVPLLTGAERGNEHNAAYAMDRLIMIELKKKIASGEVEIFPYVAPVTSKPSRSELTSKVVEKRALHAVKMMARAEKRAKSAQRTLTKWKTKVRYYEKKAAK